MRYLFLGAIVFAGAIIPLSLHAAGEINLSINPNYPGAFQEVAISAESDIAFLEGARYIWRVNGEEVLGGEGRSTLSITTGGIGEVVRIDVMAETLNGDIVTGSGSIKPAEVDLIWEAESYVPPFYQGKALLPPEGDVRVVAMPLVTDSSGAFLDPSTLLYTWKYNDRVYADRSGYGRQVFAFTTSPRQATVGVEVRDRTNTVRAATQISLNPTDPLIRLYEESPLRGIVFSRSLTDNAEIKGKEATIVAFPYYFSTPTAGSSVLEYVWRIDGKKTESTIQNRMTFRAENRSGDAEIRLGVLHAGTVFQKALTDVYLTLTNNEE